MSFMLQLSLKQAGHGTLFTTKTDKFPLDLEKLIAGPCPHQAFP